MVGELRGIWRSVRHRLLKCRGDVFRIASARFTLPERGRSSSSAAYDEIDRGKNAKNCVTLSRDELRLHDVWRGG
jgi:hypothetical protein